MSPIDTSPDKIAVSPSRLLTDGGIDENVPSPDDSRSSLNPETESVSSDTPQAEVASEVPPEPAEESDDATGANGRNTTERGVEAEIELETHRTISLGALNPESGLAKRVRREASVLSDAYDAEGDGSLDLEYLAYRIGSNCELHIIPADKNPLFALVKTDTEEIVVSEYKAFDKVRSGAQLNQFVPRWAEILEENETEAARRKIEAAFVDAVQDFDEGRTENLIAPPAARFLKQQTDSVRLIVPTGIETEDAEYEVTFKPDPRREIGEFGSVRFSVAFANDPSPRVIADTYSNRLSGVVRGFESDWGAKWLFDYWDGLAREETVENEQEQALIELFCTQMSNLKIGPLTEHVVTEWWQPNNTRGIYVEPDDGAPFVVVGGQYIKNFVDQHRHEVRKSISELLYRDGVLVERPGNRTPANHILCENGLESEPSVWMIRASRLDFDPESLFGDEDEPSDGGLSPNVAP
jgi:hypothetical protein